jgi:hypothetical protein
MCSATNLRLGPEAEVQLEEDLHLTKLSRQLGTFALLEDVERGAHLIDQGTGFIRHTESRELAGLK